MKVLDAIVDRVGEDRTLALLGLLIGIGFGFFAQQSRFCLRSAVMEFSRNLTGGKLTVWLFAFATAVATTQLLVLLGLFDATDSRQISAHGSLSGALVSGVLFGAGMIMARGCAVGSGLSGAAIFTATAWVALSAIWTAALITDRLLDLPTAAPLDQAIAGGPTAATA